MGTQVTLTLPDKLYEYARRWAELTQRELSETLTDALALVLTPLYTIPQLEKPISELSDEEVLALSKAQLGPDSEPLQSTQKQHLSALLKKQREGELTEDQRPELFALMQIYHQLWIRQSEALAEAVRRGLREPLSYCCCS